jgi:hypothetical protein
MKKSPRTARYAIVLALVMCAFSFPTVLVHAQGQASVGGTGGAASCGDTDQLSQMFCNADIPKMLNSAFQVAIRIGAILAVLRIAYAGYLYMGSEDMWSSKSAAKEAFRDAIVGLLILLAIWLILHQIDPRILSLKINFPAGGGAAQQQSQQNSSVFVAPSGNGTVIPSGQN